MATNLMNVFKNVDLQGVGKTAANIVSLAFKPNKKTGAKIARAVLDDGTTLIKTVTASGVVSETIHTPCRNIGNIPCLILYAANRIIKIFRLNSLWKRNI